MGVFIHLLGSPNFKDLTKYMWEGYFGHLKLGVLGAWMTFKKAEMAKTLRNGLSMIERNPLNHNWWDFAIYSGFTLHQFQKKLLLSKILPSPALVSSKEQRMRLEPFPDCTISSVSPSIKLCKSGSISSFAISNLNTFVTVLLIRAGLTPGCNSIKSKKVTVGQNLHEFELNKSDVYNKEPFI